TPASSGRRPGPRTATARATSLARGVLPGGSSQHPLLSSRRGPAMLGPRTTRGTPHPFRDRLNDATGRNLYATSDPARAAYRQTTEAYMTDKTVKLFIRPG